MKAELSLRLLATADDFDVAAAAWSSLLAQLPAAVVTQNVEYLQAYLQAFAPAPEQCMAVLVYADKQLVAVFPMRRASRQLLGLTLKVLEFPQLPMPIRDVLIAPGVAPQRVVDCLREQLHTLIGPWDCLHLADVPATSSLLTPLSGTVHRSSGLSNAISVAGAGYVQTRLNSNARNNLRRNIKKLSALGDYQCRTVTAPGKALEEAFSSFLETEAAGWKSVSGGKRAVKLHADQTQFYRTLLHTKAAQGLAHIHLLLLDGRAIASDYCVVTKDVSFSLKHGYDETYAAAAPGNILRAYTIDYYEQDATVNTLDLVSNWDWHSRWKPMQRTIHDVKIFNRSVPGYAALGLQTLRRRLQHARA